MKDAAPFIRASVREVERMRLTVTANSRLRSAVGSVKLYQSQRFQHRYRDLISDGPYQNAVRFFLDEIYGSGDYSSRDAQFARIAGAIDRLLPKLAVATAVTLAQVHVLTEQFDFDMGRAWLMAPRFDTAAEIYSFAWRSVGKPELIGIGGSHYRLRPCHTTRHAGPHRAVREVEVMRAAAGPDDQSDRWSARC
jgi:hypothetical protein